MISTLRKKISAASISSRMRPLVRGAAAATTDEANPTLDPAFLQSVLGSLPGVDPNDPRIQSVLQSMPPPDKKDDEKKEGDK